MIPKETSHNMDHHELPTFLMLALALYATPGPATISLAAAGATAGFRRALPYVAGMLTGFCMTVGLSAVGLGALFALHPAAFEIFRWLSFAFILYLAWRLARAGLPAVVDATPDRLGYRDALVLNLLNPKAYIAAMAVITPFADPADGAFVTSVTFVIYLLPLVAITNLAWCLVGAVAGRRLATAPAGRYLMPAMAALLACSAVWALI